MSKDTKKRFTSAILLATWKVCSLIKPVISRSIFVSIVENINSQWFKK